MGRPHVDLIGQRFGKLIVEELIGHTKKSWCYLEVQM